MLRVFFVFFLLFTTSALAQSPSSYLQVEGEIRDHDLQLSGLSDALENWLAGRQSQAAFSAEIESARKHLKPYQRLEKTTAASVSADEGKIVGEVQSFAGQESPDFEGQKALFLALSRLTESRTSALMSWRQKQLKEILASKLSAEQQAYYRWELAWTEVWVREVQLTRQLELAFLDGSGPSAQELLKDLLKLRVQADGIACPDSLKALDTICKERLTLLIRTAEQLLRLKKRQSSGALTRVRRLSRQLSSLTRKFLNERLDRMKALSK